MFTLRFDMRAPEGSVRACDLYSAAIEMCAWAESRGAVVAVLSEHHGTEDGHLPSPLILASAIAARTGVLPIMLAAVVLPFRDPVLLAEEICVLDNISKGRVIYAFGVGHREEEYAHFGVDIRQRGRIADKKLAMLLELLAGGVVTRDGHPVSVTPRCTTPAGPMVLVAGGSSAAVRRAARHGLGFVSQVNSPELKDLYESQSRAHGHEPGMTQFPTGAPTAVFVADDPDRAWAEIGSYLLHDAKMAAAYRHGDDTVASISRAETVAELREAQGPYRVWTIEEAAEYVRGGQPLPLLPLCGGLPPERAWHYLENAVTAVELRGVKA
jgi:alkanesulfonate monooxygenase SsuD/methylene tetrahydromethanopterin reductase-like flavin-dependent oxidoreductase (luciferase family)